jgi:hypothetical protein
MICFTRPSSKLIVSLSFSMAVTVPSPNCGWDTRSSIAKPDASGMGSFDTGGPAAIFCLFRAGLCGRLLRCRAWHRSPSSTAQMADLDLLVGIANDAARCPYAHSYNTIVLRHRRAIGPQMVPRKPKSTHDLDGVADHVGRTLLVLGSLWHSMRLAETRHMPVQRSNVGFDPCDVFGRLIHAAEAPIQNGSIFIGLQFRPQARCLYLACAKPAVRNHF